MEVCVQFCPEYNALVDMHKDLCRALPINDLFPNLISRRVISFVDKKKLCQLGRIEEEITQEFIERHIYPQLATWETANFYGLLSAMREESKSYFLATKVEERIAFYQSKSLGKNLCDRL